MFAADISVVCRCIVLFCKHIIPLCSLWRTRDISITVRHWKKHSSFQFGFDSFAITQSYNSQGLSLCKQIHEQHIWQSSDFQSDLTWGEEEERSAAIGWYCVPKAAWTREEHRFLSNLTVTTRIRRLSLHNVRGNEAPTFFPTSDFTRELSTLTTTRRLSFCSRSHHELTDSKACMCLPLIKTRRVRSNVSEFESQHSFAGERTAP